MPDEIIIQDNSENTDWNQAHSGNRVPVNDTDAPGAPSAVPSNIPAWEEGSWNRAFKAYMDINGWSVLPEDQADFDAGIMSMHQINKYGVIYSAQWGYKGDARYKKPGDQMSSRGLPTPNTNIHTELESSKAPDDVVDTASLRNSPVKDIRGNPGRFFDARWDLTSHNIYAGDDVVPLNPDGYVDGGYFMYFWYFDANLVDNKMPFNTSVHREVYVQGYDENDNPISGTSYNFGDVDVTIPRSQLEASSIMFSICFPQHFIPSGAYLKITLRVASSTNDPMYYNIYEDIIDTIGGGEDPSQCPYPEITYQDYCDEGITRQLRHEKIYNLVEDVCESTTTSYEGDTSNLANGGYIIGQAYEGHVVRHIYSAGTRVNEIIVEGEWLC